MKNLLIILSFFCFSFILTGQEVLADYCDCNGTTYSDWESTYCTNYGCEWKSGNISTSGTVSLTNPLGDLKDPSTLIGKIIGAALGLVGSLALAMFIYGGFIWMT
ncbi:MAG: hypothetical protein WCT02_04400, partial [Candidatus Paceibacterota bacterium]